MSLSLPHGWQLDDTCVDLFLTMRKRMMTVLKTPVGLIEDEHRPPNNQIDLIRALATLKKETLGSPKPKPRPEPKLFPEKQLANKKPPPEEENHIMLSKLMNSCMVFIDEPFQSTAQKRLYHALGRLLVEHHCAKKVLKRGTYAITDFKEAKEWINDTVSEPENRFKLKHRYQYH